MKTSFALMILALVISCSREIVTKYEDIYQAAKAGDAEDVTRFLKKGAPIETKREAGKTPLHAACIKGDSAVVALLLEEGANRFACDDLNNQPADYAIANCHAQALAALFNMGLESKTKDDSLIDHLFAAIKVDCAEVAKVLLDSDPEYARDRANDLFMSATEFGSPRVARELLAHGVDVERRDFMGRTAMHGAVESGDYMLVVMVAAHDADVKVADKNGITPLHIAANKGYLDIARFLINANADVNAKAWKFDNATPLSYARWKGHKELETLLKSRGGK